MKGQHTGVAQWRARLRFLRSSEAAQLLEFALVLPLLVVMVIGAVDFGAAWLLKDKLSNAARDGARIAASQFDDLNSGSPPASVTAVRDAVANYLTNAKVTTCAVDATPTGTVPTWQYTSTSGGTCSVFLLKIERRYTYPNGT